MRLTKWMAFILALCLLASIGAAGLSEAQSGDAATVESAVAEAEAELADSVDADTGLIVDDGSEVPAPIDIDALDETTGALGEGYSMAVDAPERFTYAEVAAAEAPVYAQANDAQAALLLHAGDLVLTTGGTGYYTAVAFYADGKVQAGFMNPCDLLFASDAAVQAKLDAVAASGSVALYDDDINWPLVPLTNVACGDDRAVSATKDPRYTDYSLDKMFTINGVQLCISMFPDDNTNHNCFAWANDVYETIWGKGCRVDVKFVGSSDKGLNMLANLNEEQRKLTPEHLKLFVQNAVPGATIRIYGPGGKTHSLMIVEIKEDGFVTMDSHEDHDHVMLHCRYYPWKGFCNYWIRYDEVYFIKWPGAKQLPADAVPTSGDPTPTTVSVTGVKLDKTELTLNAGGTAKLTATVEPSNATDNSVTWSSSDESVAKVQSGTVTAVKAGSAKITVTTKDGGKTASCTVTVNKAMTTKALTKTGSNGSIKLAPGEQVQLTADFATKRGWKLKSAKSSKSKYASIDPSTGIVTAHTIGTTTITITTKNKKKATLKVVVEDPSVPSSVKLNRKGTVTLKVGKMLQLKTAVLPTTATTTYTWASSKPKIASVDQNGNVTALKKGTCYIAVRTANGKIAKVKIKVKK